MMKFIVMAQQRGRESLKFVSIDPKFPPRIEVDPRSGEAKIIVTASEKKAEQRISARILLDAPQPTVIHSLTVAYQQCVRELQWK